LSARILERRNPSRNLSKILYTKISGPAALISHVTLNQKQFKEQELLYKIKTGSNIHNSTKKWLKEQLHVSHIKFVLLGTSLID
jgi:hypothetical protein